MQKEVKLLLLKIIKNNGSITPLLKLGFQYAQILEMLNDLLSENLLVKENSKIQLTKVGFSELNNLNKLFNRKNSGLWIEPELSSKILQIDKTTVFLPKQNELYFDL